MKLYAFVIMAMLAFNLAVLELPTVSNQSEVSPVELVFIVSATTGEYTTMKKTIIYANQEFQIVRRGEKNTRLKCVKTNETMLIPTSELASARVSSKGVFSKPASKREKVPKDAIMLTGPSLKVDTKPGPVRIICPDDQVTVLRTIPYVPQPAPLAA